MIEAHFLPADAPASKYLERIRDDFERCWPWLERAVNYFGETHTKRDVWREIKSKNAQLWPLPNGAIVIKIGATPNGKKQLQWWLAGGDLREICETKPQIEALAYKLGCRKAQIIGRDGWARIFPDYRKSAVILTKDLVG